MQDMDKSNSPFCTKLLDSKIFKPWQRHAGCRFEAGGHNWDEYSWLSSIDLSARRTSDIDGIKFVNCVEALMFSSSEFCDSFDSSDWDADGYEW